MQRKSYYDKIEKLKLKQELAGVVNIEKSYALADYIKTTPIFFTLSTSVINSFIPLIRLKQ